MEKRVTFNERWLPYVLVAPQIFITLVFFFWPSGQMVWQSLILEDAFGGNTKFVWFENFAHLFTDDAYFASARLTLVFSFLVASLGLGVSLLLAVMADRVIRGATADQLTGLMKGSCEDFRGVTLVPHMGHWIQQEAPAETNKVILDFLHGLK